MKLTTKRLALRDLKEEDKKDLASGANNYKISKWLLVVPYPYTIKDAEWFINHCKEEANKKPRQSYELAIELKAREKQGFSGRKKTLSFAQKMPGIFKRQKSKRFLSEEKKLVGVIGLTNVSAKTGKATIGYWLNENYWKQGIASEALEKTIEFAFNKLKLKRLEAGIFEGNKPSVALMKKFGAKYEGKRIKAVKSKSDNKVHNELRYAIIKENGKKYR